MGLPRLHDMHKPASLFLVATLCACVTQKQGPGNSGNVTERARQVLASVGDLTTSGRLASVDAVADTLVTKLNFIQETRSPDPTHDRTLIYSGANASRTMSAITYRLYEKRDASNSTPIAKSSILEITLPHDMPCIAYESIAPLFPGSVSTDGQSTDGPTELHELTGTSQTGQKYILQEFTKQGCLTAYNAVYTTQK